MISLKLPFDWEEVSEPTFAVVYKGTALQAHNATLAIKVLRLSDAQPDSYRQIAIETTTSGNYPNYKLVSLTDTHLAEQEAVIHIYTWHLNEDTMVATQLQAYLQVKDLIYIFTCTTSKDRATQDLPLFEQILASMRFVPIN